MLAGTAARKLADDLGHKIGSEAFVAGLLHDLGVPVMHKFFRDEFASIVTEIEEQGNPLLETEEKYLGMTHQEIGKFLANKWHLPEHLSNAIEFHHKPSLTEKDVVTSLVHLVDYMLCKLEVGNFYLDKDLQLDESVLEVLGIASDTNMDEYVESYRELFTAEINSDLFG